MRVNGAKSAAGASQQIISLMPVHDVYIEACLGSGAVLRAKKPARRSIGIEADPATLESFRAEYGQAVPGLELVSGDCLDFLQAYPFQGGELVYVDPPYLREKRRSVADLYRKEWTADDHVKLLSVLNGLACPVMISGYASELYKALLPGWRTHEFGVCTRAGKRAVETVWMNFDEAPTHHDLRFLGRDRTDRQRIKRKAQRWVDNLAVMAAPEREFLLAEIRLRWPG